MFMAIFLVTVSHQPVEIFDYFIAVERNFKLFSDATNFEYVGNKCFLVT